VQGFSEVIMTKSNYAEAVWSAVMHSGLGPVSPNTVLLSWLCGWRQQVKPDKGQDHDSSCSASQALPSCSIDEFVDALKGLGNMQRAVCVLKGTRFPRNGDKMPPGSTIDIYWVVDDGGLCLLLSYIISRNPIWSREVRLRVFAVTTVDGCDHEELEKMAVEFLMQIRINAAIKIVTVQEAELADDFRSQAGDRCPKGSPKFTIVDKFHGKGGDDDISNASSASEGQLFGGLMPVGENACLPNLVGTFDNDIHDDPIKSMHHYVAFTEPAPQAPSEVDILSVEMAKKFNRLIQKESPYASLVVTHLPLPHKADSPNNFMEYVDALVDNIDNMLLIQGTGVEYLTTVA
jgi:potassium/chloride transporter 4/5/6